MKSLSSLSFSHGLAWTLKQKPEKLLIDTKNATKSFARANDNIQPLSLFDSAPSKTNFRDEKKGTARI